MLLFVSLLVLFFSTNTWSTNACTENQIFWNNVDPNRTFKNYAIDIFKWSNQDGQDMRSYVYYKAKPFLEKLTSAEFPNIECYSFFYFNTKSCSPTAFNSLKRLILRWRQLYGLSLENNFYFESYLIAINILPVLNYCSNKKAGILFFTIQIQKPILYNFELYLFYGHMFKSKNQNWLTGLTSKINSFRRSCCLSPIKTTFISLESLEYFISQYHYLKQTSQLRSRCDLMVMAESLEETLRQRNSRLSSLGINKLTEIVNQFYLLINLNEQYEQEFKTKWNLNN